MPFLPFGAVIHCAPARSTSGRVSGAGPIHFAFQLSDGIMPVTHWPGKLQSDAVSFPSHVRTFHQMRRDEASGLPAYATSIACAPGTFPESHRSPSSAASFSREVDTSTRYADCITSIAPCFAAIFQPKRGVAASTPHGSESRSTVSAYGAAPNAAMAPHANAHPKMILLFMNSPDTIPLPVQQLL